MIRTPFAFAPPYELPSWPAPPLPAGDETHDVVIVGAGLSGLTVGSPGTELEFAL